MPLKWSTLPNIVNPFTNLENIRNFCDIINVGSVVYERPLKIKNQNPISLQKWHLTRHSTQLVVRHGSAHGIQGVVSTALNGNSHHKTVSQTFEYLIIADGEPGLLLQLSVHFLNVVKIPRMHAQVLARQPPGGRVASGEEKQPSGESWFGTWKWQIEQIIPREERGASGTRPWARRSYAIHSWQYQLVVEGAERWEENPYKIAYKRKGDLQYFFVQLSSKKSSLNWYLVSDRQLVYRQHIAKRNKVYTESQW